MMAVMFTNVTRLVLVFSFICSIHLRPSLCQFVGNCPCLNVTITESADSITISCREPNIIFDDENSVESCIDINSTTISAGECIVENVIVATQFQHTYVGDLTAILQRDTTEVRLFGGGTSECEESDVNVVLSDDATLGPWNDTESVCGEINGFGVGGTRRPIDALSAFDGVEVNGRWILYVTDGDPDDDGIFGIWSLTLTLSECPTSDPTNDPTSNPTDESDENDKSDKSDEREESEDSESAESDESDDSEDSEESESAESGAFRANIKKPLYIDQDENEDEDEDDGYMKRIQLIQETLIGLWAIFAVCMVVIFGLRCCCKRGFDKVRFAENNQLPNVE